MINTESKIMIGNRLQHLLKINGFNITTLIEGLNINKSILHDYLNNEQSPTIEDLVLLANLLNTSLDYLVGNSDYILDTWDYDFLEELFQFSSGKINKHFHDRQSIQIPDEDDFDAVLFGLLTCMTIKRYGKSFEDLTKDEIANRTAAFGEIISIFNSCVTMSNQDCFDIKEFRALNRNIVDYLFGDFSFVNERILNGLEDNLEGASADNIQLLKDSVNQNIRRSQTALKILDKMSEDEGGRGDI